MVPVRISLADEMALCCAPSILREVLEAKHVVAVVSQFEFATYLEVFRNAAPFDYNRARFMAITIGTQLGSYEITALLGKGGMGEVYRARDTKLKRDVAIKILPDEFARNADRVSRFQREAEVLASLNHPNIAGIYDLEEAHGSRFLVLELVEGDTLADVLSKRGALPVDEALHIAKQICEALEAAHEKGIIHRDRSEERR